MHWRFLFLIILPLCTIDLIFAYFYMQEIIERTFPKVEFLSIVISVLGFGGILFGFISVGNYVWFNVMVIISLGICVITFVLFILFKFKLPVSILKSLVFKIPTFTLTTMIGMIVFMMLIAADTILFISMQLMARFTALESGMMILPGAIVMGLLVPIVLKIFVKIGV